MGWLLLLIQLLLYYLVEFITCILHLRTTTQILVTSFYLFISSHATFIHIYTYVIFVWPLSIILIVDINYIIPYIHIYIIPHTHTHVISQPSYWWALCLRFSHATCAPPAPMKIHHTNWYGGSTPVKGVQYFGRIPTHSTMEPSHTDSTGWCVRSLWGRSPPRIDGKRKPLIAR